MPVNYNFRPEPVFGHGQLYLALSRATSRKNLTVLVSNGRKFQGDDRDYVKNIVYKDVLKALDRRLVGTTEYVRST